VVEPVVELPEVGAVDRVLHLRLLGEQRVVVGVRLGERGADLVEAVEQVAQRADAVLDVAAHVLGRVELRLLLEQPDGRAGASSATPRRGSSSPGHDPEQRRLPGAVRAEHADLRPGRNESEMFASTCRSGRRTCRPGTSCTRSSLLTAADDSWI
jgi:hypothetical protein